MEEKYEYLVTYDNPHTLIFTARRGRKLKQTKAGADKLAAWARSRGYTVKLKQRTVGEWIDV